MTDKENKAENTIAVKHQLINNIKEIKEQVVLSEGNDIRLRIETKHWIGYRTQFLSKNKNKHKLNIKKATMISILENIIEKERDEINKCIDIMIDERKKKYDR